MGCSNVTVPVPTGPSPGEGEALPGTLFEYLGPFVNILVLLPISRGASVNVVMPD
jgi:hypothetical protein